MHGTVDKILSRIQFDIIITQSMCYWTASVERRLGSVLEHFLDWTRNVHTRDVNVVCSVI